MLQYKELKRLLPIHKEKLLALENICRAKDGTASSVCSTTEFNCRRDVPVFFLAFENDGVSGNCPIGGSAKAICKKKEPLNQVNKMQLIGYLSVFLPEDNTAELNVLVHPGYRRQGIFTELLQRANTALSVIGTEEFVFVCEPSSTDASAAMPAMKAEKKSSEYQMLLENTSCIPASFYCTRSDSSSPEATADKPKPANSEILGELLEATPDDLPLLGRMNALFFETSDEMGELFAEESYYTPGTTVYKYLITDEHQKTVPIGTVCFFEEETIGNIFGLGILPEYRGHGYGKDLLAQLFACIPADKKIILQVSDRNAAAFQLYQKAGFRIIAQQDFWLLP